MAETTLRPFLMFEGCAEEAMTLYAGLLPGGEISELKHREDGTVERGVIRLAGQTLVCFDSPVKHAFTFTPSLSLFVDCASLDELERLAAALSKDGGVLMELADYGFSQRFTWVSDRFGVSWQINLP